MTTKVDHRQGLCIVFFLFMFIEVTQRTEAPYTNTKAIDATTVTSGPNSIAAVVGSVMRAVIVIMGVVIVVVVRKNRLYFYILFHS